MNGLFRAASGQIWLYRVMNGKQCARATSGTRLHLEQFRKGHVMYAILTFFAAFTAVMFIATAITSIVNSYREDEAVRRAVSRRVTF
jgi:uncharacterized membrane protein YraQ (UPF0718 family)